MRLLPLKPLLASASMSALIACGPMGTADGEDGGEDGGVPTGPFAAAVIDYRIGEGGGFGEADMPGVLLGPPMGGGANLGSRDVLSLGLGGTVTLQFDPPCPSGDGPDLIVFENAFRFGPAGVFTEPASVAIAVREGSDFVEFPCAPDDDAPNGCAGMSPVFAGPGSDVDATDVENAGGDAFDFDALQGEGGLSAEDLTQGIALVRVTDVGGIGGDDGTSGFDLDAIACVNQ